MKNPLRLLLCPLLVTAALAQPATAGNLVIDGTFQGITYSGSLPLTTLYGEVGTASTSNTLNFNANEWSTSGYNFVFAPNTADVGNGTTGASSGKANEAPGQYNISSTNSTANAGYGSTYLFGANNGGTHDFTTNPFAGNFLGADGAYNTGAITQTINNLVAGNVYALTFYWAGAQQQGASFTSATTENWTASLGSQSFTTGTVNTPNKGFSGWMQQTFNYTATGSSETLSFLASGTPTGQPPFALLGGVSLNQVPEPSSWALFAGLGVACTVVGFVRRRRRSVVEDGALEG